MGGRQAFLAGLCRAAGLASALAAGPVLAQTPPPPAGWSLGLNFGPRFTTNALDTPTHAKRDTYVASELSLAHRWALGPATALTVSVNATSEVYRHYPDGGIARGVASLVLSHRVAGTNVTLGYSERKAMSYDMRTHDSASRELALGASRAVVLAPDWTLIATAGLARRYAGGAIEDDLRARAGLTLARKFGATTFRIGGGVSWLLEDPTPVKPRIRDRGFSLRAGLTHEWAKDREFTLGLTFGRTFSSYAENRTKGFSFGPGIGAVVRF